MAHQFASDLVTQILDVELEAGSHGLLLGIVADAYSVMSSMSQAILSMFSPEQS
jgi:hypothetical protein